LTEQEYKKQINNWYAKRTAALEKKDGWMSLAGLYQVEEGTQSFGSDSTNDIIFPPKAPSYIGNITKQGSNITTSILPDVKVLHDSTEITGEFEMRSGVSQSEATVLRHDALLWYIIKRRGNYYIRLKDTQHPNFKLFDGVDRFPASKKWRIKAIFKVFESPKSITIPDIVNEGMQDSLYGMLEFTIDGQNYSIAPLNHPQKDDEFFIVFGDKTNGESTYSGGRYMYVPTPDENGETYLDFNKSYNPPCVFTQFATCPLPPSQNRLPIKITAGEKMVEGLK
jgi:uncharacterized protein (DUF1684 family)